MCKIDLFKQKKKSQSVRNENKKNSKQLFVKLYNVIYRTDDTKLNFLNHKNEWVSCIELLFNLKIKILNFLANCYFIYHSSANNTFIIYNSLLSYSS